MVDVEERAERLRVLIQLAPYLPMEPGEAVNFVPVEDRPLIRELEDDDLDLANACLEVERELRAANFARLERVLAIATAGESTGTLDDRLWQLSMTDFAHAAEALIGLGWVDS
jgi:hypothetical protein